MNPLSALFGVGVALRNSLYNHHVFRTRRLFRPVVSVGNISVGGSGKTPFVIALGLLLAERGIPVDVLSRGYGRQSDEILIVDPKGPPERFGDEPLLIARRLNAPVIVGADRYQAGLFAERQFPNTKLHLLDDGFQHRRLHRDFDIVLLTPEDARDRLLPAGRLREPLSSLKRADALVNPPPDLRGAASKPQWHATRRLVNVETGKRALAFCGLGRPQQFFQGLKDAGANVVESLTFPDHHRYRQADVDRLLATKNRTRADIMITTEKDEINLENLAIQIRPSNVVALEMQIAESQQVIDHLLNSLEIS